MKDLLASLGEPKVANAGTDMVRQGLRTAGALLVPLVIAAILLVGGSQAGTRVMGWLLDGVRQSANSSATKTETSRNPAQVASNGSTSVQPSPPGSAVAQPLAEGPETPGVKQPLPSNRWWPNWPGLLILPLLGWVAYRIATWRADLEPDDSDEFTKAMDDALPVILARQSTPRVVKRFVNKVRFIAMRQRQVWADDRTLWEKLWGVPLPHASPGATGQGIPDGLLVVLAALHYWHGDSLDSDVNLNRAQQMWPTLQGYAPDELEKYRARYREYASGLRAN
jgi:hypothetical protein